MGDCVESLAEVEVDNIHGSPLIYPASHAIIESYQTGQARVLQNFSTSVFVTTAQTIGEPRLCAGITATATG